MPTIKTSDKTPIDLDTLLSHIRRLGIAVGNPEMQRLRAIFAQTPELSRNELRNLLGALLAKDDWQRTQISQVFDRLVPFDSEEPEQRQRDDDATIASLRDKLKSPDSQPTDKEGEGNSEEETKEPFSWKNLKPKTVLWGSFAAVIALVAVLILVGAETTEKKPALDNRPEITQPKTEQVGIPDTTLRDGDKPLELITTIDHWIPHVESRPRNPWPQLIPALLLLLGSGLGFSWLLYKVFAASRPLKANRPTLIKESGRFHVAGVSKATDYHLLNGDQRREMSWGISRYQSEQALNRLNIPLSVKRSATAGMPQLAFEHSSQEREVWLWQDQSSRNPDLSRLADEISHTLQRANINVQRGYFRGIPATVKSARGEVLWSSRHEYPETEPLVVVFADAENLGQRQLNSPEQSDRTLQQLSHWSLLCFVDSSQQAGTLQRLLHPHALECVLPQAVADWLANQGQSRARSADNCVLDSLHQWAMACALPNRVIMEDEMRALHNALGFDCAWQFHSLTRYAKASGRGFDFRANRVRLLNELSPNAELSELAKKAVNFWIARNHDLDKALKANEQGGPAWEFTKKQLLLERDTALLKLWLGPDKTQKSNTAPNPKADPFKDAAKTLYDLYAERRLQKDISRELSYYCCHGFKSLPINSDSAQQIILPFAWNDLDAETQRQLVHCGFGGQPDPKVKLRLDNATRGVLAGLAAIIALSSFASVYLLIPKPVAIITRLDSAEPPKDRQLPKMQENQYLAGTYKSIGHYQKPEYIEDHQALKSDEIITVSWQRQAAQAAQFSIDKDYPEASAQHWLLGTIANPKRPELSQGAWPDLSIFLIFGDPQNMGIRKLAAKLLDTGSADQVLLGYKEDLKSYHLKMLRQTAQIKGIQWAYIGGPILNESDHSEGVAVERVEVSIAELIRRLKQSLPPNVYIYMDANGKVTQRIISRKLKQFGFSAKLPGSIPNMLLIPGGKFEMGCTVGRDDVLGGCREPEFPSHSVLVQSFAISQHEVTVAQFSEFVNESAYLTDAEVERVGCIVTQDLNSSRSRWAMVPDNNWRNPGFEQTNEHPVTCVSWSDAQAYVKWLSSKTGLKYRLPTEAEWEFAARGGKQTAFFWGNGEARQKMANYNGDGDGWLRASIVGSFPPNAFGLNDMHGNVWEWVQDCWHENYEGAPSNGVAWEGECTDEGMRVRRGGSWDTILGNIRASVRSYGGEMTVQICMDFELQQVSM